MTSTAVGKEKALLEVVRSCLQAPAAAAAASPQTAPGSSEGAVQRILDAASLFGRLGLPDALVDSTALKRQYRQLALIVHPDKCGHKLAKEAFQKLSEAFDCLADEFGQRRYLAELGGRTSAGSAASCSPPRRRRANPAKRRWWDTKTWEEFERRFHHRDAAEAALHQEFASSLKAKFSAQRVRSQVQAAERTVEHCDHKAGFPENDFWPSELRFEPSAAELERHELNEPAAALARLLDLLTYLRTVHLYCLYCGCVFDSFEDLERNCPGFTEEAHQNASNLAARTSEESAIEPAGQVEVFEEDSLDAFMAGMQKQLHQDLRNSAKSIRKRDQTQKGWSFDQQAQQNKNERKRMKRGR